MTLKELHLRAKELGIKGFSKMKKDELASAIGSREQLPAAIEPVKLDLKPLDPEVEVYQAQAREDSRANQAGQRPKLITSVTQARNVDEARKKKNMAKRRRRELRAQGYSVGFVA